MDNSLLLKAKIEYDIYESNMKKQDADFIIKKAFEINNYQDILSWIMALTPVGLDVHYDKINSALQNIEYPMSVIYPIWARLSQKNKTNDSFEEFTKDLTDGIIQIMNEGDVDNG